MIHPVFIGCDVSKAHLDLYDPQTARLTRIANETCAIDGFLGTLAGRDATVILEATGRYDRHLCAALEGAGLPFCRVNPARARDFARATGRIAKTDALDARMLAHMGETLRPAPRTPPDASRRRLESLQVRRDQLVATRQQERLRLHTAEPMERDSLVRHIAWLDAEIAAVEKSCRQHVDAHETLRRAHARLRSIPGVGQVTALTLLAHMPELGQASPKAMAALAGLAPFNVDSGKQRGQRHIRGGRKRVRDALYMAALVAYRLKTPFARTLQAMTAASKPFKVTIIAIARKILVTANAILRDDIPFKTTG